LGKIIKGEPFEVDWEATNLAGVDTQYLDIINAGKVEMES